MPLIANLYSDWMCTTPAKTFTLGVAGVTGQYSQLSQWQRVGNYLPIFDGQTYYFYRLTLNSNSGFSLGGGSALYDFDFSATTPSIGTVPTDTNTQGGGTTIYNPMFTGRGGQFYQETVTTCLSLCESSRYLLIQLFNYIQTPDTGTRQTWNYYAGNKMNETDCWIPNNTAYPLVKMFQITIENKKFYMIAAGISGDNRFNPSPTASTTLFLIPEIYFKDKPVNPYIGPVSKDSAESSFIPDRGLIHDSIEPRDLSAAGAKNPYGFNTGNLKLYKIAANVYYGLTHRIFNAASGSLINSIGQLVNSVVGGNSHRPSDEVDTIIKSIMCCHLIPDIDTITVGDAVAIQTIGGYPMGSSTFYTGNPLTNSIIEKTRGFVKITPTWNSFIDYEPYTTISLHIPFIGNIDIPPSVLYGNNLALHYVLDAFSGTLSVDVLINDIANGNAYIYTTLQTSCNTQLPIVGTGSNGDALLKIATGLTGAAISTSPMTKVGSIFSVYSGLADTQKSVPHTNFSQSNIAAYLDSRHCYFNLLPLQMLNLF